MMDKIENANESFGRNPGALFALLVPAMKKLEGGFGAQKQNTEQWRSWQRIGLISRRSQVQALSVLPKVFHKRGGDCGR